MWTWLLITAGMLILNFMLINFSLKKSKVSNTFTLLVGVCLSILLSLLVYGIAIFGLRIELFLPDWFAQITAQAAAAATGFWFFREGRITIPIKHKAVVTFLEKRLDDCPDLNEGDAWLIPKISDAIIINTQDFNIDPEPFEVLSKELMRVMVDLSIVLAVECPKKYLDAENAEDILVELSRRAARVRANDLAAKKIALQDSAISEAVLVEITPSVSVWGLRVKLVKVENVTLPKKITDAAELYEIEKYQRKAEVYEANTLKQKIEALVNEFGDKGMTPDKAANLLQAESGKITRTAFDLEGVNSADLAGAIAAFVAGLSKDKGAVS